MPRVTASDIGVELENTKFNAVKDGLKTGIDLKR